MHKILLSLIFVSTSIFAEVSAKPSKPSRPTKPITKPKEIPSFDRLTKDSYVYNPLYNDVEIEQKEKLAEKKKKIEALEKELNATRRAEEKELQKKNKAQYDKAMEKFENRKSSIETKNTITISDEPIK